MRESIDCRGWEYHGYFVGHFVVRQSIQLNFTCEQYSIMRSDYTIELLEKCRLHDGFVALTSKQNLKSQLKS